MRFITFIVAVLLLAGCGSDPAPEVLATSPVLTECLNQDPSLVKSLEVRYSPADRDITISAFLRRDEFPHQDTFYFAGALADGAKLKEPLGKKPPLEIKCEDKDCQRFSFTLQSEYLKHSELVTVRRHDVEKVDVTRDTSFSTKPLTGTSADGTPIKGYRNTEQQWHYSVEKGIQPQTSSFLTSCLGGKRWFTVYLGVNERTSLGESHFAISGGISDKKFSIYSLQDVEGRPISSMYGAMEYTVEYGESGFRVTSPSAAVDLTLKP